MDKYLNTVTCGDALNEVTKLPAASVNCVITSPPYWQLRDYGFPEQWGLEPTYQEYLENLWSLMDEIFRVLKDDGTVWVNLGDTYGGSGGGHKNELETDSFQAKRSKLTGCKPNKQTSKCLLLIPHRFGIGCIDRGWIMRNDIIWGKRNGMPESCRDRFSKKHEYIFFMVKNQKYYFDLDGVRESYKESSIKRMDYGHSGTEGHNFPPKEKGWIDMSTGKNPGSVSDFWDIPTQPSSEKHYASFNTDLIDKPIIAGCPEDGIILDPFAGTGTTLVRAIQLNR